MKPATKISPNGPTLADKLEKLRGQSEPIHAERPPGHMTPAAVGPTARETARALKEMRPVDLPQHFLIYDDADSAGDISDADPEFLEWAAKAAGDSTLQELE